MPELPEVERGRRLAASVADGRRIERAWCADDRRVFPEATPRAVRAALEGRRVVAARRWGKQLWFDLDEGPHPLFHFGMTGAFRTRGDEPLQLKAGPREDRDAWPPRFTRIRLRFDDGGELAMTDGRRFAKIVLRAAPREDPPISALGFDPLLAMPTPGAFTRALHARRGVLKSLLLDQSFAAGVGNWIADEALYQAGLDPRRRVDALDDAEIRRLRSKLGAIVRRAVQANADDRAYPRSWLFHVRWGRDAHATTAKGERVEHVVVGGRTTAWVPAVQR